METPFRTAAEVVVGLFLLAVMTTMAAAMVMAMVAFWSMVF